MPKTRSPNYPVISLTEAISKLRLIYQKERHGKMEAGAAITHMGYGGVNGKSLGVLSALKKYGLLQGEGESLRISSDGVVLVVDQPESAERQAAVRRAALSPALFAELHGQFGEQVPSEDTLRIYLQKKQFIPPAAATAARTYRDTMELVSSEGGAYNDPAEQHNGGGATMQQQTQAQKIQSLAPMMRPAMDVEGETERLRLPLRGGRAVRLIFSGSMPTQADITKLIALLELTKDTFPESEQEEQEIAGHD